MIKEYVSLFFGALFPFIYSLPAFGTFVFLLYEDMRDAAGFFSAAVIVVCDIFLSTIWPIYWGILRWIF